MSIGINLQKLRRLTDATKEDIAQIAHVTRGAVSRWEIGQSEPRMGALQKIADHFYIKKSSIVADGGMDCMAVGISGRLYEIDEGGIELCEIERGLINLYRSANAQGKETIMAVARVSSGMGGQHASTARVS